MVRKRCMSEQILLEFPAALRYLVQEQALSVGASEKKGSGGVMEGFLGVKSL